MPPIPIVCASILHRDSADAREQAALTSTVSQPPPASVTPAAPAQDYDRHKAARWDELETEIAAQHAAAARQAERGKRGAGERVLALLDEGTFGRGDWRGEIARVVAFCAVGGDEAAPPDHRPARSRLVLRSPPHRSPPGPNVR
jgi:hypothetical protein